MNNVTRVIRILAIALCVLSIGVFIVSTVIYRRNTDITGPEISMDSAQVTVSIHDDDTAILSGVTAKDAAGKDVTQSLIVESLSTFSSSGVREASIAAFDSRGNVTKAVRTITYSDYTAPTLSLSAPLAASVNSTGTLLDGLTVTDCLDGDITDQAVLIPDSDTDVDSLTVFYEGGEIPMRLQVSNSAGDILDIPVTVTLFSSSDSRLRPQVGLNTYLVYLEPGQKINPEDYLSSLTYNSKSYTFDAAEHCFLPEGKSYTQLKSEGSLSSILPLSAVEIDNPVDTDTPGVYEITYRCVGSASAGAAVRLVVIVVERGE